MAECAEEIRAAILRMRALARDPVKRAEMEIAWNAVIDQLEVFYLSRRPRLKSFEVHHMNETARYRFACAIAAGHSMSECTALAVARIVD